MKRIIGATAGVLTAVLCLSTFAGCGGKKLESRWLDRDIAIDGKGSEWRGCEVYDDEDSGVRVAFFNDDECLYVFVSTMDTRTQAKALMNGFTVYVDPEGGKKETFGIRFPVKRMEMYQAARERMRDQNERMEGGPGNMDPDMIRSMLERSRDELEIIGPGKGSTLRMTVEEARDHGIEVMIDMTSRVLEYELKIPLSNAVNPLYDLGIDPGTVIGVGFETGASAMRRPSGPPGGEMGGGRPGGDFPGGGPPGGGGGMGGGMRGGMGKPPGMEPLEIWAKLVLAAGSGTDKTDGKR